jgi:hemerythrin-like metal-binding protein
VKDNWDGIAGLLREFRKILGVNIADMAGATGVAPEVYEDYETGDPAVPIGFLYKAAGRLGIDVTARLTGRDPRTHATIVCRAGRDIELVRNHEDGLPPDNNNDDDDNNNNDDDGFDEDDYEDTDEERFRPLRRKGLVVIDPEKRILEWQRSYSTGIDLFDRQHKEFIKLTNQLYAANAQGWKYSQAVFKKTIRWAVKHADYLRNEEKIMDRVNYPERKQHKREHREFVQEVLRQVQNFQAEQKTSAGDFVLFLRDWIQAHVGISDKNLGAYLVRLKREKVLGGIIMRVKRNAKQELIIG